MLRERKKDVRIGLEIHGYLATKEKLFCRCRAVRHAAKQEIKPNSFVCPICTGQPGSKPMLPNAQAIRKIIEIALMLNCKVNTAEQKKNLVWQRKHYNWPDLPKGFQSTISGPYAIPTGTTGNFLGIKITEAHLEEDPAAWNPLNGEIDYNKSGYPLIEIVTEPDFTSSEQVTEWLKQLTATLKYVKAIDGNLGIKVDVNVSLPEKNGKRIEIKNINSVRNIKTAIEYEIERQSKPGELPKKQETRMFDELSGKTVKMREKELSEDYRFVSEPDLPVIKINTGRINKIKSSTPELPQEKIKKLIKKHKIGKKQAEVLGKNLEIAEFFEEVSKKANPLLSAQWITGDLLRVLNYGKKELDEVSISPYHFAELLNLVEGKKITELKAKEILNRFVPISFSPAKEIKKHSKISSEDEIEKIVKKIMDENPRAVKDYKSGKKESLNFLIGMVMKKSEKRADYNTSKEILERLLE